VHRQEVAGQRVRTRFVGSSSIELLRPTSEDSPVAKFLAKRGGGVHICFTVEDIDATPVISRASGFASSTRAGARLPRGASHFFIPNRPTACT
jgi:methylmalonyl-CoA/ethylmalonyl-CoA epimerase